MSLRGCLRGCCLAVVLLAGGLALLFVWDSRGGPENAAMRPLLEVADYARRACFLEVAREDAVLVYFSPRVDKWGRRTGMYPLQILEQSGSVRDVPLEVPLGYDTDYVYGLVILGDLDGDGVDDLGVMCRDSALVVYASNWGEWKILGVVPEFLVCRRATPSVAGVQGAAGMAGGSFLFRRKGDEGSFVISQGYVNERGELAVLEGVVTDPVTAIFGGCDYDGDGQPEVLLVQDRSVAVYSPLLCNVVYRAAVPDEWDRIDVVVCGDDVSGDGSAELYVIADQGYRPESIVCLDPVAGTVLWQWNGWVVPLSDVGWSAHRRISVVADVDGDGIRDVVYACSSEDSMDAVTVVVLSGASGRVLRSIDRINGMPMFDVVFSRDGALMAALTFTWSAGEGIKGGYIRLFSPDDLLGER